MPAFYLHDLSPFVFQIGGWGPRWYGVAYVISFLVAFLLYRSLARRGLTDMPEAKVADFITYAAIFGVMLGGRIGWIVFYGWRQQHDSPWWMVQVWEGGMASHGGILALVLFTLWWARRHRVSWTGIGDSLCVSACPGLALVRVANFVNGELWGRPAAVPWAVQFPQELGAGAPPLAAIRHDAGTQAALRELLPPRHPSQLYEALLEGVLLFGVLWLLRTRARVPRGVITGSFFLLYAALRIVGEMFREPDPAWSWHGWSAGQVLSLVLLGLGAAFFMWGLRARQYEPALTRAAADGKARA